MNNNSKMWAMLLHLGSNMWSRPGTNSYHSSMLCDKETWVKITSFLPECGINTLLIDMGEGVFLKSHPEMAIDGTWSQEEFKEDLARIRELGITPLPKYNFSCCHNGWMKDYVYKVGTPEYEQFCRDVVEETIELFGKPEFFHLGLEEETVEDQLVEGFPVSVVRSADKLIENANDLFKTCRNKGVRPWMWLDPNLVKTFGGEKDFRNNVPKDVLLSNWYYGLVSPDYHDSEAMYSHSGRIGVYDLMDQWGYEQVPTVSSYLDRANPEQTMRYCKETFNTPDNVRGYITAPWVMTTPDSLLALKSDAWFFGCGKRKIYPDCK